MDTNKLLQLCYQIEQAAAGLAYRFKGQDIGLNYPQIYTIQQVVGEIKALATAANLAPEAETEIEAPAAESTSTKKRSKATDSAS